MMSDSMDMASNDELLHLMQNLSLNSQVRVKGWDYILALSAADDGVNYIIQSETYIPFILSFIQHENAPNELSAAYRCLVNISGNRSGCSALLTLKKDFVHYLLNSITNADDPSIEFKCYILNNLTTHLKMYIDFSEVVPSEELLNTLMECVCSSNFTIRKKYDYLNFVFSNITRIPAGRRLFMKNDKYIHNLAECLQSYDIFARSLGAALTLRNCCFDTDNHKRLLDDLNILPVLLCPIMGYEPYRDWKELPIECQCFDSSKVRTKILEVRRALVQALLLLCNSEYGWNYLKSKGVYCVASNLLCFEDIESNTEDIETLAEYMLADKFLSPKHDNDEIIETLALSSVEYV